jgi:hypothetical protein
MTMPWSKDTASARTCIAKSREEPLATLGKCLDRYRGGSGQDLDADPPAPAPRPRRHDRARFLRAGRGPHSRQQLPVAKGTVIVSGNRIAVEVKELLPHAPGAC